MTKIKQAIDGLIASRKGILALIGLVTIQTGLFVTVVLFVVDWALSTGLVSFEFVKDVFTAGFQWDAGIITAYSAANITQKFIKPRKK